MAFIEFGSVSSSFLSTFSPSRKNPLLKDKVEASLSSLEKCVASSELVFDGSFRPGSEFLDPKYQPPAAQHQGKSHKKHKGKQRQQQKVAEEEEDDEEDDDYEAVRAFNFEFLMEEDVEVEGGDCLVRKASKVTF